MRRVVVLLAMSTVAIAGCGSSGGSAKPAAAPSTVSVTPGAGSAQSPGALVAASYSKMTAAKTAKLDLTFHLTAGSAGSTGGGSGTDIHFTGTGVQDFANKKALLTVQDPSGETIEERLLGRVIYVKLPPAATGSDSQLRGKSWLKTDLDKAAQSAGLGSSGAGSTSDPTQILQLLSSVSDQVTKVGDEKVRGTDTTHYHAVMDLTKASTSQGNTPQQADRLKQLLGTSTMPVDVWVDGDGLARRLQFQMPLPKAQASQAGLANGSIASTEEFYDFGTPVSVDAPPADQTVDALSLSGAGGTTHA
jgi:hypothetical protein